MNLSKTWENNNFNETLMKLSHVNFVKNIYNVVIVLDYFSYVNFFFGFYVKLSNLFFEPELPLSSINVLTKS